MYYFNVYLSLNVFFLHSIIRLKGNYKWKRKNNTHPVKLNVCYDYVVVL